MMIGFIRHGQTTWNLSGRIQGTIDAPLTVWGAAAVRAYAAAAALANLQVIWSSPLQRASQTAHILAQTLGSGQVIEVRLLAALTERNYGVYQGQRLSALQNSPLFAAVEHELSGHGVEDWPLLTRRVKQALGVIAAGPAPSLVVVHGGWMKALHALLETGLERENGENLSLVWMDRKTLLKQISDSARFIPSDGRINYGN